MVPAVLLNVYDGLILPQTGAAIMPVHNTFSRDLNTRLCISARS